MTGDKSKCSSSGVKARSPGSIPGGALKSRRIAANVSAPYSWRMQLCYIRWNLSSGSHAPVRHEHFGHASMPRMCAMSLRALYPHRRATASAGHALPPTPALGQRTAAHRPPSDTPGIPAEGAELLPLNKNFLVARLPGSLRVWSGHTAPRHGFLVLFTRTERYKQNRTV